MIHKVVKLRKCEISHISPKTPSNLQFQLQNETLNELFESIGAIVFIENFVKLFTYSIFYISSLFFCEITK